MWLGRGRDAVVSSFSYARNEHRKEWWTSEKQVGSGVLLSRWSIRRGMTDYKPYRRSKHTPIIVKTTDTTIPYKPNKRRQPQPPSLTPFTPPPDLEGICQQCYTVTQLVQLRQTQPYKGFCPQCVAEKEQKKAEAKKAYEAFIAEEMPNQLFLCPGCGRWLDRRFYPRRKGTSRQKTCNPCVQLLRDNRREKRKIERGLLPWYLYIESGTEIDKYIRRIPESEDISIRNTDFWTTL